MAQNHLHELLKQDQEPFHLKNYIADKHFQLKKPIHKTTLLQVKKHKPLVEKSTTKLSFYKQACFLSFQASPDVKKSPSFNFPSPLPTPKSPCKSPKAAVFLHIPVKTAALLLEAAIRIQKQKQKQTQIKNVKFGLFGSILKKLKDRNMAKKCEIGDTELRVSVTESSENFTRKCEKMRKTSVVADDKGANEVGFSWNSNNNSRLSSAGWSESNEEKSSSFRSESDSEETKFVAEERESGGFSSFEEQFCSSPFRFSLQRSPSDDRGTPDFLSPATSPNRHKTEEKENYEIERLQEIKEEVEEKEQCSPVSVLDPPFVDEDDGHESEDKGEGEDEDEDEDEYDIECSYARVQRAKLHLLQKLRRFEKLAELDPIELEKRISEEEDELDMEEDDNEELEEENEYENDKFLSLYNEHDVNDIVRQVFSRSTLHCLTKAPTNMKRLVSDLISEEKREMNGLDDNEVVAKRVCKRLDAWKGVESNTIDMMVDLDFRREIDGWNKCHEQVEEVAMDIEVAMFMLLVEELSDEN